MTTTALRSVLAAIAVASLAASCSAARIQPTPDGYAKAGASALARGDYEAAERDFRSAIAAGGDGEAAAISRDMLRELYGARLYPDSVDACPATAQQAYHDAEEEFGKGGYAAASELFRAAADQCPSSATIRVSWADTFYRQGDYERSSAMFHEALAIDPWNRAAWRYLADAESRRGRPYAAWEASLFAVLSDPTYEMAWVYLGRYGSGPLRRVRADKPRTTIDGGTPTLHIDPDQPDPDRWMSYALSGLAASGGTPLDRERKRVEEVLAMHPVPSQSPANPGFWEQMQAAKEAGYLDEAIFVHMIDADLAPEYASYRDAHRDRLVGYMRTLVTTPPPSPKSGAA